MDIKILEDLFQLTIERGSLWKRQNQIICKRIIVDLGLLKSGAAEHVRSGKPEVNSWDSLQKVDLIVKNIFSAGMRILQGTES